MRHRISRFVRSGRLYRLASSLSQRDRERLLEYLQLQLQIQALESRCIRLRRRILESCGISCRHLSKGRHAARHVKGGRHECR